MNAPPKVPPKGPPPPPPAARQNASTSRANTISDRTFSVSKGVKIEAQKVVLYGTGGCGKSSLAASLKDVGINPLFIDIGDGTAKLNIDRIGGKDNPIDDWTDLRRALHLRDLWSNYDAIVIDDLTKAEEMAADWVIDNVPHEKGRPINGLTDYGYGKGYEHVFDEFLKLVGDLDAVVRADKHVVCIAHEIIERVPNPGGEDWLQYQPRLQNTKQSNIRYRMKEWCDHLLFCCYDVFTKDGKGEGGGTRSIYSAELPTWLAKSREISEPIAYEKGSCELWRQLLKKGN
jgi:hypothetical protein